MSRAAIDKAHEHFVSAMRTGDAAALADVVSEDVTFYPPHEPSRRGRHEVRAWAEQAFSAIRTERIAISDRNVVVSGDWAFEIGSFVWAVVPVTGGRVIEDRGRFIAIWQRQADGTWKTAHDMWNSTIPVA